MTCECCSHYDSINSFCWLHWREVDSTETCPYDMSEQEREELEVENHGK